MDTWIDIDGAESHDNQRGTQASTKGTEKKGGITATIKTLNLKP